MSASSINRPFTLCVYCGSRFGNQGGYADAAKTVGQLIGRRGWQLVYGGGDVGLMGTVANAALDAGARVIGVITQALVDREVGHLRLHEQHVVQTMHQRKQMMAERADAFLALPGGIGTLEELYEVWTWHQLGYHRKPLGLLNAEGYFDELLAFMKKSVEHGFLSAQQHEVLVVSDQAKSLLDRLHAQSLQTPPTPHADFKAI